MLTKQEIENGLKDLPSLPAAVTEIMIALEQKGISIEHIKDNILGDPGLSSKVLSVANSPFYGLSGNIASIKEACVILGFHTLRNIAMAVGVISGFPSDSGKHLQMGELWRHGIGTGVAARVLALDCKIDPEVAFTTGLFHDIGKMVFDQCFSDDYGQVMEICREDDCQLFEAERKVLGIDHAELGAKVARRWNFPEMLVDTIENHHSTDVSKRSKLTDLICVADIVCRGLEIGDPGDGLIPSLQPDMLERLALDMPSIIKRLPEIEEMSKLSDAMHSRLK